MAGAVHPGRFSAEIEGDFVVFLIGMRFNKPWRVRQWLPVVTAMPKMLTMLDRHPESAASATTSGRGGPR